MFPEGRQTQLLDRTASLLTHRPVVVTLARGLIFRAFFCDVPA